MTIMRKVTKQEFWYQKWSYEKNLNAWLYCFYVSRIHSWEEYGRARKSGLEMSSNTVNKVLFLW